MTVIRTTRFLFFMAFAIFNMILLGYLTNFDRFITAFAESQPQVNNISNFTDQMVHLKNLASNQSSDIKDIKKLTSEQVQLLKSLGQEFSKTTTQSSFAALGIFFLGP
jgi:predicted PurR-regulated permease PerM